MSLTRLLCFVLVATYAPFAVAATWTGSVNSSFTDPNNWEPATDLLDDTGDNLVIGAGSPNAPVYNTYLDPRPASFNSMGSAHFTMLGGELLPYGNNNVLNGDVFVLNGWFSLRGSGCSIGNGARGQVTVDGGTFDSKYALYIGRNAGGSGTLNVLKGVVNFPARPILGNNGGTGRIYIEEGGFCYHPGSDDVAWYQAQADSGLITTSAGSAIVVDYQAAMNRTRITARNIAGATLPEPWNGTEDVDIAGLGWNPGTRATQSRVYFGTTPEVLSLIGTTSGATMALPYALNDDTTYYWRVDTVNPWGTITGEVWSFTPVSVLKPRQMEKLDRGIIAIRSGTANYISWRLFGTDPQDITFNVYRGAVKLNVVPIANATNYTDASGTTSDIYSVRPVWNGQEQAPLRAVPVQTNAYFSIPVQQVPGDTDWSYDINDGAVGDLDGNGDYELVIKRFSTAGGEYPLIEAYRLDGTFLWRINLGPNLMTKEEINPIVYDLDSDGFAEVVLRTCEGNVDGTGQVIGDTDGDGVTDYCGYGPESDFLDAGPEFVSVFDGRTGREIARTDYIARDALSQWGDTYGHRANKFHIVIAYLDGHKPSLVVCRGIYTMVRMEGWNYRNGELSKLWYFTSEDEPTFAGQGNHNLSIGDVDADGKDEIVYGGMCVDHDGRGLYSTGQGHGDAMHLGDLDPARPGLEVWRCVETSVTGAAFTDAATGEVIFEYMNTADVGRACAGDIDPRYLGCEVWGSTNCPMYTSTGTNIGASSLPMNFMVWWDGDLQRELLDHAGTTGQWYGTISKWNYTNGAVSTLLSATGTYSNNWTKGNPVLSGDIFGDWREEALWRSSDNRMVRIYTTTIPTTNRFYTLMHDPQYRLAMAWQCCAYNQPPHTGFYLGGGMIAAPVANIELVDSGKGGLLREYWLNAGGGGAVSDLTSNPNYPDSPTGSEIIADFEGPTNWGDSYGARVRGYVCPPETADYTFWVAGDNACQLWLSADALDSNRQLIASVPVASGVRQWDQHAAQQSAPIALAAGHKYYIEALHKEASGSDHLAVAWQANGTDNPQIVDGAYLSAWGNPLPGDLTVNGRINLEDAAAMSAMWLLEDCTMSLIDDANGDCVIDLADIWVMADNWLFID